MSTIPIISGTNIDECDLDLQLDTSKLPSFHVSKKFLGHDEHRARVGGALKQLDLLPSGSLTIDTTDRVTSPGADMSMFYESARLVRDDLIDLEDHSVVLWGGINFDGSLMSTRATYAVAKYARDQGCLTIVIPKRAHHEMIDRLGIEVITCATVEELISILTTDAWEWRKSCDGCYRPPSLDHLDGVCLSSVEGCELGKLALEVAAAGHLSVTFISNDPIAERLPRFLPTIGHLTDHEIEESLAIGSICGRRLHPEYPVRAPHPSTSPKGLIGSGTCIGEVSLAHHGFLCMINLPEFTASGAQDVAYALRSKSVHLLSPGFEPFEAAADFRVLATMTACPCGLAPCRDSSASRARWIQRASRIRAMCAIDCDPTLHVEIPWEQTSENVRERVRRAREVLSGAALESDKTKALVQTIAALDGHQRVTARDVELAELLRSSVPVENPG